MSTARDYALALLDRTDLPGWKPRLLRRKIAPPGDERDLALAENIHIGVIKNHALLEYLLAHYARRPGRIDPLVRKIAVIGLYQLRFLTRIPQSAAVDEAVKQAKRFGRSQSANFLNAVLRAAIRHPDVPLPSKEHNPEEYAETVLSHPHEIVRRLVELAGVEKMLEFCKHNNTQPPTIVRLFRDASAEQLLRECPTATPHQRPGLFVVESARRAIFARWAACGLAQVQDATSAQIVAYLDVQPGQRVLDRCAGLGTKTLQIQELVGPGGWVMAMDVSGRRCKALQSLIQSRKIGNVSVVQASMLRQVVDLQPPVFDRILLDVPCSNSGVLARRPEARYAQTPEAIESLTRLQDELLDDTAAYLKPGGLLVYSTCSIWPEENEARVERFVAAHPDFKLLHSQTIWPCCNCKPDQYHDGGYYAVLRRN